MSVPEFESDADPKGSFSSNYGWLNMIPAFSAASVRSPRGHKDCLRKETRRHGNDEEYGKSMVAVPFNTPPQWGAVVSIVSALLVAGEAGNGSLRQRESSAACARFLCLPPLQGLHTHTVN